MFLGMSQLISQKLVNNDKGFFRHFTTVRARLESSLILHKDLVATILQRTISKYRAEKYAQLIDTMVREYVSQPALEATEELIVSYVGLTGKILTGTDTSQGPDFSDDTKSAAFIRTALKSAMKCPVCGG